MTTQSKIREQLKDIRCRHDKEDCEDCRYVMKSICHDEVEETLSAIIDCVVEGLPKEDYCWNHGFPKVFCGDCDERLSCAYYDRNKALADVKRGLEEKG